MIPSTYTKKTNVRLYLSFYKKIKVHQQITMAIFKVLQSDVDVIFLKPEPLIRTYWTGDPVESKLEDKNVSRRKSGSVVCQVDSNIWIIFYHFSFQSDLLAWK